MRLIDTHCHLFAEEFDQDRDTVIGRAQEKGVQKFLLPNIDSTSIEALYKVCEAHPDVCLPMMGLHPTSVKDDWKEEVQKIEEELRDKDFVAIGEIGIDYYWDTAYKEQQKEVFRLQLKWAKELNLPVAIHTRNSFEDAIHIVKEEQDGSLSGVFHCFSGTAEDAQRIIDAGFYMGIGGVVTFKNGGIDKILPEVPVDYLVLETDSPYLAPVPYRGKRNESAYLVEVINKLSDILQAPAEELAEITSRNAEKLFKL